MSYVRRVLDDFFALGSDKRRGVSAMELAVEIRGALVIDGVEQPKPRLRVASYLSPPDFHRLNWACQPIADAYESHPYLVGSVLHRPDFRDVDLRLILDDEAFAAHVPNKRLGLLLNIALSDLVAKAAGLASPIDFQIQSMTEANGEFGHQPRNPMGMRR